MAIRITTYKDAFKLIGVMPSGKINDVIGDGREDPRF